LEQWLAPKEVAGRFGLHSSSAYRWIDDGTIPENFIRRCGRCRIRIHPDIVPLLEKTFREAQE
jgi:predicted site-specific integrase-resolvase